MAARSVPVREVQLVLASVVASVLVWGLASVLGLVLVRAVRLVLV